MIFTKSARCRVFESIFEHVTVRNVQKLSNVSKNFPKVHTRKYEKRFVLSAPFCRMGTAMFAKHDNSTFWSIKFCLGFTRVSEISGPAH